MNLLAGFLSRRFLLPLFLIILVIFIYSLWDRSADIDDAWIGEYAYWLAEEGYVHSELMRGINLQEELFVVHHKLFSFHGALFIRIFGFSLYSLKAVSLVYFLVFVILFYFYTVRWKRLFSKDDLLFALFLIFIFPLIFKFSFLYRPEIMMMTFGFSGYILLEKYIESSNPKFWQLFLAGILFGLTMATHLNGLILVVSAFFLLVWNRKFLAVFGYGFGVVLAFLIYFYDFTDLSYFELWRHQFFDSPSLDSLGTGPVWLKPIINLFEEHIRYFHNERMIVFSTMMLFLLIVFIKFMIANHTMLVKFSLLVAFFTGLIAMHKSTQYILLNFPYIIILITLSIKALKEKKITSFRVGNNMVINSVSMVLIIVFVIVSMIYNIHLATSKFSSEDNRKIAVQYAGNKTSEMNIVAPMTFIFDEIKNFNRIQGDLAYIELQKLDPAIQGEGFLKKAETFDISLIMVSGAYHETLGISQFVIGDTIGQYNVLDKNDQLLVFKRLQ